MQNTQMLPVTTLVEMLETLIREYPQVEIPTNHSYAGGIYEREIFVPAGALITGKIHLHEHLAKLVSGTMSILSDSIAGTWTGPVTFCCRPGEKRLGFARTDCVFSTYHTVVQSTPEEMEQALVVSSLDEYKQAQLEGENSWHLSQPVSWQLG